MTSLKQALIALQLSMILTLALMVALSLTLAAEMVDKAVPLLTSWKFVVFWALAALFLSPAILAVIKRHGKWKE